MISNYNFKRIAWMLNNSVCFFCFFRNVSAVINFLARVILDSNNHELHNYLRFIIHIISVNKPAVYYVLSVFDELEIEEV